MGFADIVERVVSETSKVVKGRLGELRLIIATILVGGHVLLEGPPGTGKTLMARAIASAFNLRFRRIQFTPDTLPMDLLGQFTVRNGRLAFRKGPVFTDILLADEINRASPRVHSALLEAMQERSVTILGKTYKLSPLFTVVATMNPFETEGVYPLSEAQLDRFTISIKLEPPGVEELEEVIEASDTVERWPVKPVAGPEDIEVARRETMNVYVDSNVRRYIAAIIAETWRHPSVKLGASPRAAIDIHKLSRALALMEGRTYATPDHVREAARAALPHRVFPKPEAKVAGVTGWRVVEEVLEKVHAP